jgi:hypothetical protein
MTLTSLTVVLRINFAKHSIFYAIKENLKKLWRHRQMEKHPDIVRQVS